MILNRVSFWALLAMLGSAQQTFAQFSDTEKANIQKFWNQSAKYTSQPDGLAGSEWVVRLTPSGSKWIREVYRTFQSTKVVPTQDPRGNTPEQQSWVAWIDRQVARDWAESEIRAKELNQGGSIEPSKFPEARVTPAKFNRKTGVDSTGRNAPSPNPLADDPCPTGLIAAVGNPPRFSAPVRPFRHRIEFPDGSVFSYSDNVKLRQKYAYYRFADGVNSEGQSVRDLSSSEIDGLFRSAGLSSVERNVMKTVSLKEGGFDSVNTYDTGFVSVGFVQFATLAEGAGSLGEMMSLYKTTNSAGFDRDFRKYGIDVLGNKLMALDIENGVEKIGPDANNQVIHDKRLIAVFQRAGQKSRDFRVAQLLAAKKQFYPADDRLDLNLPTGTCSVRLGDVFRSEAGLATLMDRKVNTGNVRMVKEVLEKLALQYGIQKASDLSDLEFVAARQVAWRTDYTLSASLAKPRDNRDELSRRGSRLDRKRG